MSENNTPTNEDATNDDSPSAVLDTSGAGGPHILPPRVSVGPVVPPPPPAPPPAGEFMVEVELAPGVETDIDTLLSGMNAIQPIAGGGSSQESDVARVARTYGMIEARPVFTREEIQQDEARISALRNEISAAPHGVPESLNELDQLPPLSRFIRLRFPPGATVDGLITDLNALPQVRRAVVVPRAAPPSFPTDPMIGVDGSSVAPNADGFQPQWYLHRTRVKEAWQIARGEGVVIADVDWGCMTTHQELAPAIELTYNAVDGSNDVTHGPQRRHGTGVLGQAGARADAKGLAGYAPKAALWAIQGDSGVGPARFTEPWVEAVEFVTRTSAGDRRKVIIVEVQTEFGGNYEQVPSFHRAVRAAITAGCVVCVAAGNGRRRADQDDRNIGFEPTGSIVVGATMFHATHNFRAFFSNYGPTVDVSAPGDKPRDVTCGETNRDGEFVNNAYRNDFGGTSGAAAKVAGACALILSANRKLSHSEVRDILKTTGSPMNNNDEPIGVFLNTEAAVLEARRRLDEP